MIAFLSNGINIRYRVIVLCSALLCLNLYGQTNAKAVLSPLRDSIVVTQGDSIRTISYIFKAIEPKPSKVALRVADKKNRVSTQPKSTARLIDFSEYSVGAIPIQSSVSPTGARLYCLTKEGQIVIYGKHGLGEGLPTHYWINKK